MVIKIVLNGHRKIILNGHRIIVLMVIENHTK